MVRVKFRQAVDVIQYADPVVFFHKQNFPLRRFRLLLPAVQLGVYLCPVVHGPVGGAFFNAAFGLDARHGGAGLRRRQVVLGGAAPHGIVDELDALLPRLVHYHLDVFPHGFQLFRKGGVFALDFRIGAGVAEDIEIMLLQFVQSGVVALWPGCVPIAASCQGNGHFLQLPGALYGNVGIGVEVLRGSNGLGVHFPGAKVGAYNKQFPALGHRNLNVVAPNTAVDCLCRNPGGKGALGWLPALGVKAVQQQGPGVLHHLPDKLDFRVGEVVPEGGYRVIPIKERGELGAPIQVKGHGHRAPGRKGRLAFPRCNLGVYPGQNLFCNCHFILHPPFLLCLPLPPPPQSAACCPASVPKRL